MVGHNIDLAAANVEFHQHIPKEHASLTTALLLADLLIARGELMLSAEYLSEIVTAPTNAALIDLQFRGLLAKRGQNAEQIGMFQDAFCEGRALREVINSGERTFAEFRTLLDKSRRFKAWVGDLSPDRRLINEYYKSTTADTWVDSLPIKTARFVICAGAGAISAGLGLGASAADMFLVERIFRGWRPHHFVQGHFLKFIDPAAKR